jgi:hypothetical protein
VKTIITFVVSFMLTTGVAWPQLRASRRGPVRTDPQTWLSVGDSKTFAYTYQPILQILVNRVPPRLVNWNITSPTGTGQIALNGTSWTAMAGLIDGYIAGTTSAAPPTRILVNLGAGDLNVGLPAEAAWKASAGYVLGAIHVKWPSARVYVMRAWIRGHGAEADTLAAWTGDVVAARNAWCFLGPDERVFLENGDDGVSYTADGVHPNADGSAMTAMQWLTVLGYGPISWLIVPPDVLRLLPANDNAARSERIAA